MVWSGNSALLILSKFVHELQETVGGYQIAMSMLGWFDFTMNKVLLQKLARLLREHIKSDVEREGIEKMAEVTTDLAVRLAEPVGMVRNLLAQKTSDVIALVGAEEDDWPPCMCGKQ